MVKLTITYNDLKERRDLIEGLKEILAIKSISKEYKRKNHKEIFIKGELK